MLKRAWLFLQERLVFSLPDALKYRGPQDSATSLPGAERLFVHYLLLKSTESRNRFNSGSRSNYIVGCARAHVDACLHTHSTYADFSGYYRAITAWSLEPGSVFEVLTHLPMCSPRIQVPGLLM